jgi:hypothetical protein
MNNKKIITLLFIVFVLFTININVVSANFLDEIKEFFAKKGKIMPEYQCTIHLKNFESSTYIQSNEECMQYFVKYKNMGHTCQIYSKYNEKKGIKQCNFCIDRFLSKTDKIIPRDCLEIKIEKSHFSEDEVKQIIEENKNKIQEEINIKGLKKCYDADTEIGRISFVQGNGHIQRSSRIIPAIVGEGLMPGDTIISEKDSIVQFNIDKTDFSISDKRFQLPGECKPKEKGNISSFFGNIWDKIKSSLGGDSNKAQEMTAGAGVRG